MFRLLFLLFALLSLPAFAGECSDCDHSLAPRLWIPDGDPTLDQLPLKSSSADIRIDGPIARVTVTQRYGNAGKRPINARYVFPGSTRAAMHGPGAHQQSQSPNRTSVGIDPAGGLHHLLLAFAAESPYGLSKRNIRRTLPALLRQRLKRGGQAVRGALH